MKRHVTFDDPSDATSGATRMDATNLVLVVLSLQVWVVVKPDTINTLAKTQTAPPPKKNHDC